LAAERGLADLDFDWVALRLVLVHGPGVRGNMARLLQAARSPWPLPLGGLKARRSLLSVGSLVDAVDCVLAAAPPLRRPFLVADPNPLTIPEIVAAVRRGLGRRPWLIPVPGTLLESALRWAGREEMLERIAGSLVVDPRALIRLGWTPAISTEAA